MSQTKQLYKIKDWIFDPQVSELSRGTDQIIIPNKVAQVLLALLGVHTLGYDSYEVSDSSIASIVGIMATLIYVWFCCVGSSKRTKEQ